MVSCTLLFLSFTACCSHRPRYYGARRSITEPDTSKVMAEELDEQQTEYGDEGSYNAYSNDTITPIKGRIKGKNLGLEECELEVTPTHTEPKMALPSLVAKQVDRELEEMDAEFQEGTTVTVKNKKSEIHAKLEAARAAKRKGTEEGIELPLTAALALANSEKVPQKKVLSPMGDKVTMEI